MKKACIFLAEGFEEVEAVTPLDLLRRRGIDAKFISITGKKEVQGSHNITFLADELFENVNFNEFSAFILPGGMPGTKNLNAHTKLRELILKKHSNGDLICAICAAPTILDELLITKDVKSTVYPTIELQNAIKTDDKVCVSNNIITANALGSAIDFSLSIVEYMLSSDEKSSLKTEIVY